MAIYRNISMSFWDDNKVTDNFTPEDKYFYLYLLTNPHTNLCGCYEVSINKISNELGYTNDVIERLLNRFESVHNVIKYSKETKEILLLNWSTYNWTSSEKLNKPLYESIAKIKCREFEMYLANIYNDRVSIPYPYPMDTTVTVTVLNNNKKNNKNDKNINTKYYSNKELDNTFIDYIKMRREIKHPMTDRAIELAIKKLEKLANDDETKIKILEQSIFHSWQGIFELKDEPKEQKPIIKSLESKEETQEMSDEEWLQMMKDGEEK